MRSKPNKRKGLTPVAASAASGSGIASAALRWLSCSGSCLLLCGLAALLLLLLLALAPAAAPSAGGGSSPPSSTQGGPPISLLFSPPQPLPAAAAPAAAPPAAPAAAAPLPAPLAAATASAARCAPRFEGYQPSDLEVAWAKHVAQPGLPLNQRLFCADIVSEAFEKPFAYWVATSAAQNSERPGGQGGLDAQAAALASHPHVFSRLLYSDPCTGQRWAAATAPLAGLLRDPRGPCLFASPQFVQRPLLPMLSGGGEMLQVKDTVVVDAAHYGRVRDRLAASGGRAILMDAGASTYQQGVVAGEWPGTRWLVERFRDQGINFTDIFCWEATEHKGSEFFDGMSPELMAATRFYNFPVTAAPGPASPISVLKAVAQPGDFVVFKLDIDHPSTETPLVQALLEDPQALALLDTFYYELHFGLKEMEGFWGAGLPGDLQAATRVFEQFRQKGVNAQFWP